MDDFYDEFDEGRQVRREADAALVRGAGCICQELMQAEASLPGVFGFNGRVEPPWPARDQALVEHDPRCPHALAIAIERRGED